MAGSTCWNGSSNAFADDAMRRAESRRQADLPRRPTSAAAPIRRGVVERVRGWLPAWLRAHHAAGNHEDLLLRFLAGEIDTGRHWLDYGGLDALAGYGVAIADREAATTPALPPGRASPRACRRRTPGVLPQLAHQPRAGDYFFVHGGVRPGVPLEKQNARDCLWIRKTFLNSDADHGAMMVHGHSISDRAEIRQTASASIPAPTAAAS
jgi:serine/threonine protein phosphatase 1